MAADRIQDDSQKNREVGDAGKSTGEFVDYDRYIDRQLRKARSQIRSVDTLSSIIICVTGILGYLLLSVLIDHWMVKGGLSTAGRWLIFAGFSFSLLSYLVLAVLLPLFPRLIKIRWLAWLNHQVGLPVVKKVHPYYAARTIENSDQKFKNSLVNFLDLCRSRRQLSPIVAQAVEYEAASNLSEIQVEQVVQRDRLITISWFFVILVFVNCAYMLFSPKNAWSSIGRVLFPPIHITAPTRTVFMDVLPGDAEVYAGEQVMVSLRVSGAHPEKVVLYYTATNSRQHVQRPVAMKQIDNSNRYQVQLPHDSLDGVQESFSYFVAGGDGRTEIFQVQVLFPPTARVEKVTYEYPSYTGLDKKETSLADIDALEGTRVSITASTNVVPERAKVDFGNQVVQDLAMKVTGRQLLASFVLELGGDDYEYRNYRIDFRTKGNQVNPRPSIHTIKVFPDLAPEVSILKPAKDIDLAANGVMAIVVRAFDPDFGLGSVRLILKRNTDPVSSILLGDGRQLGMDLTETFQLDCAEHGYRPGDKIQYWIEVRDNKIPLANQAETPIFHVRITESVSEQVRDQMKEEVDKKQDKSQNQQQKLGENGHGEDPEDSPVEKEERFQEKAESKDSSDDSNRQGNEDEADDTVDREPLQSDGSEDEEALERILEEMEKDAEETQKNVAASDQESPSSSEETPQEQGEGEQGESGNGSNSPSEDPSRSPEGDAPAAESEKTDTSPSNGSGSTNESGSGEDEPGSGRVDQGVESKDEGESEESSNREVSEGNEQPGDKGANDDPDRTLPNSESSDTSDPSDDKGDSQSTVEDGDQDTDNSSNPNAEPQKDSQSGSQTEESSSKEKPSSSGSEGSSRDKNENGKSDNKTDPGNNQLEQESTGSESKDAGQSSEDPSTSIDRDEEGEPSTSEESGSDSQSDPSGEPSDDQSGSGATKDSGNSDQEGSSGGTEAGGGSSSESSSQEGASESEKPSASQNSSSDSAHDSTSATDASGQKNTTNTNAQDPKRGASDVGNTASQSGQSTGSSSGKGQSGNPLEAADEERLAQPGEPGSDPSQGPIKGGRQSTQSDKPDRNAAKKASNLVLDRLDEQLRRNEVDEALLRKLGWTEKDMRNFVDRMRNKLSSDGEISERLNDAVRRVRQPKSRATKAAGTYQREVDGVVDPGRLKTPVKLRNRASKYRKRISRYFTDPENK